MKRTGDALLKKHSKTIVEISRFIDDCIDRKLIDWALRTTEIKNEFRKMRRSIFAKAVAELPEEINHFSVRQYGFIRLFGNSEMAQNVLAGKGVRLNQGEMASLETFSDYRCFYSFFTVEQEFGMDFFAIYDHFSGDEYILYSPGLTRILLNHYQTFLFLIIDTGDICVTYGDLMAFKSLEIEDIFYFTKKLISESADIEHLSQEVDLYPMYYKTLYYISEVPGIISRGFGQYYCMDSYHLKKWKPDGGLTKNFILEKNQGLWYGKLKGREGETPHFASFYYDEQDEMLYLSALTEFGYEKLVKVVSKFLEIDGEPEWLISMSVYALVHEHIGAEDKYKEYSQLFNEKKRDSESELLESINNALEEIQDLKNNGKTFDIHKIAKKYNISEEEVREIIKASDSFLKTKTKTKINPIKGGFLGFVPPPPSVRTLFDRALFEENFLYYNRSLKIDLQIEAIIKKESRMVEDAGFAVDHEFAVIIQGILDRNSPFNPVDTLYILNYSIYLLLKHGRNFEKSTDYAKEILKIFGHFLLDPKIEEAENDFLEKYCKFFIPILERFNIVIRDVKKGSNNPLNDCIKGSDFLFEWIELQSDY
ncbi:MAG: hypothetical protein A2Y33_05630 [Spirochaetes bacterium GWF1_51_8]|nr:MAG: hypothetical protein A2Y33_05630 [Spirochaetes bacterium GWF1_51_8]